MDLRLVQQTWHEMSRTLRALVLFVWQWLDPLYYAFTRLQYVGIVEGNIFRVRLIRHRGADLTLSDGTVIRHAELLLKIHLHNARLLRELFPCASELVRARRLYELAKQSLPGIARYIAQHPRGGEIRAIVGITQMNRGCRGLGFDVLGIPERRQRWLKRLKLLPIYLLSVRRPWRTFAKHEPKMLLMSTTTLFARYALAPL